MKDLFQGYYKPDENKFKEIWQSATFVLDANILLNMYRYPEEARKQLLSVLQRIETRLWVPYQAALEFQRNRVAVIEEQRKRFYDVRKVVETYQTKMTSDLEKLQLNKRHSSIKPNDFIKAIDCQTKQFLSKLEKLEQNQLSAIQHDLIREDLERLLKGKIGEPFSQEKIDEIYKDGETRFKHEIPPGYEDRKKESDNKSNTFYYAGVTYERKYGDLVLWKQIINKAKTDNIKFLIFLTDDEKEDWWWINDFQGKKKIGPRPELVEEIFREAKTDAFYMYNSEQFLKHSKNYLNTNVTEESISQVGEVRRESRLAALQMSSNFRVSESIAARALLQWLRKKFPNQQIYANRVFPDYVVYDIESRRHFGFEVKIIREIHFLPKLLIDCQSQGYSEVNKGYIDEITFVFILPDRETQVRAIKIFERRENKLQSGVKFILGIVNTKSEDKLTPNSIQFIELDR